MTSNRNLQQPDGPENEGPNASQPSNRLRFHEAAKLTQWKPGVSGNPKGRPKREPLIDALKDVMDFHLEDGRTVAEAMAMKWSEVALAGDRQAIKDIAERLHGKPTQHVELKSDQEVNRYHVSADPAAFDLTSPEEAQKALEALNTLETLGLPYPRSVSNGDPNDQ
jgi:hypothetical protein